MAPRPILITFIILLSLVVDGLSLSINDILGFGYRRLVESETPRVVEIVRWRQPVCLTAAPGVLPCLVGLQNPTQARDTDSLKEDLKTLVYGDASREEIGSLESVEEEIADSLTERKKSRSVSMPRIYSPKIVRRVRLENMGTSGFQNPLPDGSRRGKYLRVAPQGRRQTIYEIKVVDSSVVAKLVAETCLPDIGIPLCQDIFNDFEKQEEPDFSLQYRKPIDDSKKPLVVVAKPPISVPVVSGGAIEFWGAEGTPGQLSQSISNLLNKPSVLQTEEKPALEQVIVVQPTASPGIFAGINGLFPLGGGNIFDIFNRPSGADKPPGIAGWNPFPLPLPGILQIPAIPSLNQILYRPENEISGNPGLLGILTGGEKIPPGTGPATEKPGIFGGLFASPSRPTDFNGQDSSPGSPSIFEGIGNIFKPTNRPLVIERPNEPSIVIEKPVYVVERPAVLGLFDIFQTGFQSSPQSSGVVEKPEVIKDPTYIFQKPVTSAPLFGSGLLPDWNIFNSKPSTVSTTAAPVVVVEEILIPVEPVIVVEEIVEVTPSEAIEPCIDVQHPEIPEKPVVKPVLGNSDTTAFSAAGISVDEYEGSSGAFAVASIHSGKTDFKSASISTEEELKSNGNSENLLIKIADDRLDVGDETVEAE